MVSGNQICQCPPAHCYANPIQSYTVKSEDHPTGQGQFNGSANKSNCSKLQVASYQGMSCAWFGYTGGIKLGTYLRGRNIPMDGMFVGVSCAQGPVLVPSSYLDIVIASRCPKRRRKVRKGKHDEASGIPKISTHQLNRMRMKGRSRRRKGIGVNGLDFQEKGLR